MEQHKEDGHYCEAAGGPPAGERSDPPPPEVHSLRPRTAAILGAIPQGSPLPVWTKVAPAAFSPVDIAVFESLVVLLPFFSIYKLVNGISFHVGPLVKMWC